MEFSYLDFDFLWIIEIFQMSHIVTEVPHILALFLSSHLPCVFNL